MRSVRPLSPFGEELQSLRKEIGISQKQLASCLGVSPGNLCDAERWGKDIDESWSDKIADAYNLPVQRRARLRRAARMSQREVRIPMITLTSAQRNRVLDLIDSLK